MIAYSTIRSIKLLRKEWLANYRYRGGFSSLSKCLQSTIRLLLTKPYFRDFVTSSNVDCVTFSIIPYLTALWTVFIGQAIVDPFRLIIGDCVGAFRPLTAPANLRVIPFLNFQHGTKLDLFVQKVCTAEYLIISDDDIFWLDNIPWEWALNKFKSDPRIAVVSLVPREFVSSVLFGKVSQPMGSHCLVIRRRIWLREHLSFQVVHPPSSAQYDWYYDTADYANLELLNRGYKVVIAPPEIQDHLVIFDGTSLWSKKIQERNGNILPNLANMPIRQESALRVIYTVRGLSTLLSEYYPSNYNSYLIPPLFLGRAEKVCSQFLSEQRIDEIRSEMKKKLAKLRECLDDRRKPFEPSSLSLRQSPQVFSTQSD